MIITILSAYGRRAVIITKRQENVFGSVKLKIKSVKGRKRVGDNEQIKFQRVYIFLENIPALWIYLNRANKIPRPCTSTSITSYAYIDNIYVYYINIYIFSKYIFVEWRVLRTRYQHRNYYRRTFWVYRRRVTVPKSRRAHGLQRGVPTLPIGRHSTRPSA